MLTALCAVAAMSQAFRTAATVVAGGLQAEFGASTRDLGLFVGAFHLSFAAAQIMIGVALDVFGARRTVTMAFLLRSARRPAIGRRSEPCRADRRPAAHWCGLRAGVPGRSCSL